jgi:hypothetical protein
LQILFILLSKPMPQCCSVGHVDDLRSPLAPRARLSQHGGRR